METVVRTPLGWEQPQLDAWTKEYELALAPYFMGYVVYPNDATCMGKIYYHIMYEQYYNAINIKTKFVGRSLASKAILWHEFCHHMDCVENGCHDHCTKNFKRYLRQKPLLWLIDVFLPA